MRTAHPIVLVAAALLSASTSTAAPRALFVHAPAPGAPAETTWIASDGGDGGGVRVLASGGAVRLAPAAIAAAGRYIVRLVEPASAAAFAERVGSRRALDDRFVAELAR